MKLNEIKVEDEPSYVFFIDGGKKSPLIKVLLHITNRYTSVKPQQGVPEMNIHIGDEYKITKMGQLDKASKIYPLDNGMLMQFKMER